MIVVLNPNSSTAVTDAIEAACASTGLPSDAWVVDQLDAAPPAIESAEDVETAAGLVRTYGERRRPDTLVVACHSDPGVVETRRSLPDSVVLGIGETSMLIAASWAAEFGVVSLSQEAAARKRLMTERLGISTRCAAVEATDTGVLHGVADSPDYGPYAAAARRAVDAGAGSIVLGCAGMAGAARWVQHRVGVPVVEPVAATLLAAAARLT